ncbi:TRAP transporter small permease [Rhodobacterales bacterium]|nr:TRAP transporter small permease [Rhodobacterales bacterium]
MSRSAHHHDLMSRVVSVTTRACEVVASTAILGLFGVVAINILMRALFDASGAEINLMIPGAVELAKYALLIAVFAALPAALENGLIRVDVLTGLMSRRSQALIDRFWFLALFLFVAALVWLFAAQGVETWERGEVTQDWGIPLWIFYMVIAVECAAFAVVSLAVTLNPALIKSEPA